VDGTLGTASAIAAGADHSCAIQAATGNVVCWGDGAFAQTTPPSEVDGTTGTASAITAGAGHGCAIQSATGNVVCWGWDDGGKATPPAEVNGTSGTALAVAAGGDFSLAIAVASAAPDADGDGVADASDNCPFTANPLQEDVGSIGLGSAPDGIGNACQCGDVNNDGRVTGVDGTLVKRASLALAPFPGGVGDLAGFEKCDVGGTSGCTGLDGTFITRASLGLPPGVAQVCPAAVGP
jgi:hypothetical protein